MQKTPFTEDISAITKTSGIVARIFDGTWKEIAFDNFSNINTIAEFPYMVFNNLTVSS